MNTKKSKGFTLIELLVVIAIIGLLASIVLVSLNSARGKARDTRRISDFTSIATALEMYYNEHGKYPPDDCSGSWPQVWNRMMQHLVDEGLLANIPNDPSNSQYLYACPTSNDQTYLLGVQLETNNSALAGTIESCPGNVWENWGNCGINNYYCYGTRVYACH